MQRLYNGEKVQGFSINKLILLQFRLLVIKFDGVTAMLIF